MARATPEPEGRVPQIAKDDPRFPPNMELHQLRAATLSGTGTIRETGEAFPYVVRFLGPDDIEPLLVLHHEVLDCMPEPLSSTSATTAFTIDASRRPGGS